MASVRRLVPLNAVALPTNPTDGKAGDIYYNTTDDELYFYTGEAWLPVANAGQGILSHIHTYDGDIFSVSGNTLPNPGSIDGGTP
ncbi:MAG: hypothetical protein RLZZ196_52 [Bacteroidota bacterium]